MSFPRKSLTAIEKNLLILIDADFVGGAETNYRYILPDLYRLGWSARFAGPGDKRIREYFRHLDIPIETSPLLERYYSFSPNGRLSIWNIARTWRAVQRNRARILTLAAEKKIGAVISNSMVSHWLNGMLAGKGDFRSIVHLHDIVDAKRAGGFYGKGLRWISRKVDALISISDAVTATIPPELHGKVTKLYNPVSVNPVSGASRDKTAERSGIRVGMFARYTPWKGHRDFLQIAEQCAELPVEFVAFGNVSEQDTPYYSELTGAAERLPNASRVRLYRFTPSVIEEMAACDVVLHLSRKPEPFGRVLIEANAVGRPVLAYKGGGVEELFRELKLGGAMIDNGDIRSMVEEIRRFKKARFQLPDLGGLGPETYVREFARVLEGQIG